MSNSIRGSSISGAQQSNKSAGGALRTNSGQLLRATAQQNIMGKQVGGSAKKAEANRNTAVISIDELERIKQQCSISSQEYNQQQRHQDRLELQQLSNARVQNWPNTIDALRKKKDDDRIRRLEEEELERRKVDQIEYELQMEARAQAIAKANLHLHHSQDQVKAFHSKMLLCDVVQERDQQKQLQKRRAQMERQVELQWQELEAQKMNEHDEKLRTKLLAEYEKKIANQQVVKEQLFEYKLKYIKRYQEEQLEGHLIKRQAQEELEQEKRKEHEKRLRMVDQQEGFKRANEELQKQMQQEKLKDIEHQNKIEQYAHKKDQIDQLRRDKEEQKFREKQAVKQRLVDKQFEHLKSIKDRADEILDKQVADAESKAHKLFMEKEKRLFEMKQSIEQSRSHQITKKLNEKEQKKQDEKEFTEFWKIRNEELEIARQQELEEDRLRGEELKQFHKNQINAKQMKAEDAFREELMAQAKAQALLDHNEKQFYSYAEQCMQEWQDNGKNVKPLILELKGYKKRLVS